LFSNQFTDCVQHILPQRGVGGGKRAGCFWRHHKIPPPWPGLMRPEDFPRSAFKEIPLDRAPVPTSNHHAQSGGWRRRVGPVIGPQRHALAHTASPGSHGPFKIGPGETFVPLKCEIPHGPIEKNRPVLRPIPFHPRRRRNLYFPPAKRKKSLAWIRWTNRERVGKRLRV
jgi:hypothetical protein